LVDEFDGLFDGSKWIFGRMGHVVGTVLNNRGSVSPAIIDVSVDYSISKIAGWRLVRRLVVG
jgi:hypothetical protein